MPERMPNNLIPGPENPEDSPKQPEAEQALSPEVIEKIMDKVQDIDQPGTAYSSISYASARYFGKYETGFAVGRLHRFNEVLRHGLLGSPDYNPSNDTPYEAWRRDSKTSFMRPSERGGMKNKIVQFNIVGRTKDEISHDKTQIAQTGYATGMGASTSSEVNIKMNAVTIIFDLSSYTEIDTPRGIYSGPQASRKFFAVAMPGEQPTLEGGFLLSYRVAPRKFRGIVLSNPSLKNDVGKEDIEEVGAETKFDPAFIESLKTDSSTLDVAVSQMKHLYKDKLELLLPVYDVDGNLLWPKQMTYEEVKKFVAAREDQKSGDFL